MNDSRAGPDGTDGEQDDGGRFGHKIRVDRVAEAVAARAKSRAFIGNDRQGRRLRAGGSGGVVINLQVQGVVLG